MYNPEFIKQFLKEYYYKKNTRLTASYIFEKVIEQEKAFNTNMFNFSYEQLVDTLRYFDCSTTDALAANFTHMCNYKEWAKQKGIIQENLAFNMSRRDLRNYLNFDKLYSQYFINREELYNRCERLVNDIDKAILILLYEGLMGAAMYEARLLKEEDIDMDNNCIYVNNNLEDILTFISSKEISEDEDLIIYNRTIKNVDSRSIRILKDTMSRSIYQSVNGESKSRCKIKHLINSEYLLKPARARKSEDDKPINNITISKKLNDIRFWIDKPNITPSTIHYSGMFNRLNEIKNEKGELRKEDFKNVLTLYGKNDNLVSQLEERYNDYLFICDYFKER